MRTWSLLTNHALVLIHVTRHPRSTLRQIAQAVGITERSALSILRSLETDGIVSRRKVGRCNVYTVDLEALAQRPAHGPYTLAELAGALLALTGRTPLPADVYAGIDSARTGAPDSGDAPAADRRARRGAAAGQPRG